jgi:branched-chain amino acid transport system substrate-binding protein
MRPQRARSGRRRLGASASLFDAALALAQAVGNPKDKEALAATMPTLKAETAVGTVDFSHRADGERCTVSGLAGGQWNKASEGPFQFQLDLVSNADFPQINLTSEFKPLAFG